MRTIRIKIKPNARESRLEDGGDGVWAARVKASPIDGKANAELIALIARHFGCAKSAVSIKSGASARTKVIQIA